jgi:hypothetical protein
MRQVCAASELTPRCLVLRPFAAASLLHRAGLLKDDKSALIIDMLADGADLTAVADGQVTFMRTVRLPATSDEAVQARALLGEVRRTIAAAQAQEGGGRIDRVVICGSATEHALLMQSLTESLQLEVMSFDPFQVVQVSPRMQRQTLPDAGRYAPLLGMLADHAAGTRHAIDFLNPRKRPAPPSTRRRNLIVASCVLGGILIATGVVSAGLKYYDNQIAGLNEQIADLNKGVDRAKVLIANADAVKDFTDGDVTLLDEIYELSQRIPDADHLRLDSVNMSTANVKRGAVINLKGHAKEADVIPNMEDSLRFEDNVVEGKYGTYDQNQTKYPWLFDTSVTVKPDGYDRGSSTGRSYRAARQAESKSPDAAKTQSKATQPETTEPKATEPKAAESKAAEPDEKATDKDVSAGEAKPEVKQEAKPGAEPEAMAAEAQETVAPNSADAAPATAPEATAPDSTAPDSTVPEAPGPAAPAADTPAPAPAMPVPAPAGPAPAEPSVPPATTPPPPDPGAAPPVPATAPASTPATAPVESKTVPPASADEAVPADKTEGN